MTLTETVNVRELLRVDENILQGRLEVLYRVLSSSQLGEVRREIRELQSEVAEGPNPDQQLLIRAGMGSYLLGEHKQSEAIFSQATDFPIAYFYRALSLLALEKFTEAEQAFVEASQKGYDHVECVLRQAEAVRVQGRLDEAENLIRGIAAEAVSRAEYSFQMGCIMSDRRDPYGSIEYFERAVDMDSHHSRALFRLAVENNIRGNDDEAIRLYEQALSKPPYYLGALLNLGLLYEDAENYSAAAYCFRQILDVEPNHFQAKLYLKDIEASQDMYYDEESMRDQARLEQLLSRPVTDFELSVRSRNCLQSMDIYTLRDLTEISEQELLSGKNFGETSLHEIRDMMTAHGLKIGQNLNRGKQMDFAYQKQNLSPQEQALYNKPISELNLSVRSRKCMTRLGISSIGELVHRTPDELLGSRNFGVTSLNEIRAKLSEAGLKLRND